MHCIVQLLLHLPVHYNDKVLCHELCDIVLYFQFIKIKTGSSYCRCQFHMIISCKDIDCLEFAETILEFAERRISTHFGEICVIEQPSNEYELHPPVIGIIIMIAMQLYESTKTILPCTLLKVIL